MDDQDRILAKMLIKLLNPRNTPENVLQLLSSSLNTPKAHNGEYNEPLVNFLSHIMYIMIRRPEGCVDGIWEDILWKTIRYSRNVSVPQLVHAMKTYAPSTYHESWLTKALSTPNKCPNPYMRLELFRLLRIFQMRCNDIPNLSNTVIDTISEIQPNHLYPNGDADESLFDVRDLTYVISLCPVRDIRNLISNDIIRNINIKNEVFVDSIQTRFLCHCIQLIGVSAVMAVSVPDLARYCGAALKYPIAQLVDCGELLPRMTSREQFRYVISRPPFRFYMVQTIHEITTAIMNHKMKDLEKTISLGFLSYLIGGDLDIFNKTCNLPRVLLSRQIQGSTLIRQHSLLIPLLLRNLDRDILEDSDDNSNSLYDSDFSQNDNVYTHSNSDISLNSSDNSYTDSDH